MCAHWPLCLPRCPPAEQLVPCWSAQTPFLCRSPDPLPATLCCAVQGWEKKAMCVFRATSPQWAPVTWKEAKACSGVPTAANSVYDESGKLWGWQDSSNCAFKVDGKAVKPAQLSWKTAAACSGQASSSNSVADLNGKKWGWSNGRTCAFRQVRRVTP